MIVLKILFAIVTLPGWLIAKIGYLWPAKGELFASKRRMDSKFAHLIYTILAIIFIPLFFAGGKNSRSDKQPLSDQAEVSTMTDISEEVGNGNVADNLLDNNIQDLGQPEEPENRNSSNEIPDALAQQGSDKVNESFPDPEHSLILASAIDEAARDRKNVRWRDGEYSGYAVPSQSEPEAECVNVSWSIDKIDGGAAQDTVQRCR